MRHARAINKVGNGKGERDTSDFVAALYVIYNNCCVKQ